MRRFLIALFAAAAVAVPVLAAPAGLKPFDAEYIANYQGMEGEARMTLAKTGNEWNYTLRVTSSLASLSQSTTFDEKDGLWRPLSGTDASSVLIKKKNKQALYDWNKGVATWTGDVKPDRMGPVKLQAGDMDALMVNLAIARDVQAGKPLRYRLVDEGRAKEHTWTVAGKEAMTINGKKQQATKVTRTDGNKQTFVWVVDGLPTPARILQKKDGADEIDLTFKQMR